MSVLLPNTELGARRRLPGGVDAHGERAPATWGPPDGPWPGRKRAAPGPRESAWSLALDPAAWPLAEDDLVTEPATGREWLVLTSQLIRHSEDPSVDYVRVDAHERDTGGTWP